MHRKIYSTTAAVLAALVVLQGDTGIPVQYKVYIAVAIAVLHVFLDRAQMTPALARASRAPSEPKTDSRESVSKVPPLPLLLLCLGLVVFTQEACKDPVQGTKTGVNVAVGVCKVVESVLPDNTVKTICATAEEIDDLISMFGSSGQVTVSDCKVVEGAHGKACVTEEQKGAWIDRVLASRKARTLRDAGLQ